MFYNEYDINYYELINNNINNIIINKKVKEIHIDDIKIGDYIYITFIPDSQKYIYSLYSKIGKVIKIDLENKNILDFPDIIIMNNDGYEENILHGSYAYYGNSLGYNYYIFLIEN